MRTWYICAVSILSVTHMPEGYGMQSAIQAVKGGVAGSLAYVVNTATGAYVAKHYEDADAREKLTSSESWSSAAVGSLRECLDAHGGINEQVLNRYRHAVSQRYASMRDAVQSYRERYDTCGCIDQLEAWKQAMSDYARQHVHTASAYAQAYPQYATLSAQSVGNYLAHRIFARGAPKTFLVPYALVQAAAIYVGTTLYTSEAPSSQDAEHVSDQTADGDTPSSEKQQGEQPASYTTPLNRANHRQIWPLLFRVCIG